MRRIFLAFFVLVTLALFAAAQAKHPFTFEDMMKLKRVGEPEVSPDGKWVIFSVVDVDLAANTKTPHIWIVPTAGGQEREILPGSSSDRPRWAPDGKHFAFIRDGGSLPQVWIADFDTETGTVVNSSHQLTFTATEAGSELWSPDGKNILFTSDVYPECDGAPEAEAACNARKVEERDKPPVKPLIFDRLLYRHWNSYKAGRRSHIFIVSVDARPLTAGRWPSMGSLTPRDLTPGDYDAPVFSLGGQDNYAFSPDGQEICYTSNHDKNPAASTNNDLWIVPVNAAALGKSPVAAKNITADNPASDSTPLYSPDGRYIAYRAQQRPGYESDRFRLMLYDRKTGEKKNLTEDFDRWVGTFTWSPYSTRIFFGADDGGRSTVSSVLLSTGERLQLPLMTVTATADDFIVTPDGENILFTINSLEEPNAIYGSLLCPNGRDNPCGHLPPPPIHKLTHFNDAILSRGAMSPIESFWFTGAHDDKVEGFLVKPPNFDASKKYPVKFLIHGGPQGAWGDDWSYRWNAELFAAPTSGSSNSASGSSNSTTSSGYVVIMINFHGSTGYGQKFIDAINGDWGGAPFEDLMKGLDYAEKTYPFIDKNRECALGASYGGYMANWILGHTDRFKCIVTHDGMFNAESAWGTTEELWFNDWEFKGTPYDNRASYEKWSPHQYAKNFKTPTLVIHGQRDYRLDVSQGFDLFTTLQMEGVPSKMLYFPDEGHWVLKPQNSQLWYKTVNDWVDRWTK
jgi:dipeptidyl aminopeptidase/acylaminoacyl peptidase